MSANFYYFVLSVTFVCIAVFQALNILSLKIRNKTILGIRNEPDLPSFKTINTMASWKGMLLTIAANILASLNLWYCIHTINHLNNTQHMRTLMIQTALGVIVFCVFILIMVARGMRPGN